MYGSGVSVVSKVCYSLFFMDVTKVDGADVAYVASVSEACCKNLFKMFHLFPDVCCNCFLSRRCICFTQMLQ